MRLFDWPCRHSMPSSDKYTLCTRSLSIKTLFGRQNGCKCGDCSTRDVRLNYRACASAALKGAAHCVRHRRKLQPMGNLGAGAMVAVIASILSDYETDGTG
jgi:hypothetical protein